MTDPWIWLVISGLGGLSPSAAILAFRRGAGRRWSDHLEPYRLQFPGDLDPADLELFLSGLSGIRAPRWRRPIEFRGVGFEIVATTGGIDHHLLVPHAQSDIVLSHLRAALPDVGIVPDADYQPAPSTLVGELVTSERHHQLRVDDPGSVSRAVLAALQPVAEGEMVRVQWLLFPLGVVGPPSVDTVRWLDALGVTTRKDPAEHQVGALTSESLNRELHGRRDRRDPVEAVEHGKQR